MGGIRLSQTDPDRHSAIAGGVDEWAGTDDASRLAHGRGSRGSVACRDGVAHSQKAGEGDSRGGTLDNATSRCTVDRGGPGYAGRLEPLVGIQRRGSCRTGGSGGVLSRRRTIIEASSEIGLRIGV